MSSREEADVSGFKGMFVIHTLFVGGRLLPLNLHALEDDDAWDNLETSIEEAHQRHHTSRIVGSSMIYSLS